MHPLKKISKYNLRLKSQLWITKGIQKAMFIYKNSKLSKYINLKDRKKKKSKKTEAQESYKLYRNLY